MRRKNIKSLPPIKNDKKIRLVVATKNPDKIREIKKLLKSIPSLKIFPYKGKSPQETGKTLIDNARIKALNASRKTRCWAIADDTGLEVKALGGKPGVKSARFAGPRATYKDNVKKLLEVLKSVPLRKRQAVFKTAVCIASPDGKTYSVVGRCGGLITFSPVGKNGFGYDPIFYYPPMKKTFAEMAIDEKNLVSHRSMAFRKARKLLEKIIHHQ